MMSVVSLRRCTRIVNGGTPSSDDNNWGGDTPWATPEDLGRTTHRVLETTRRTLTEVGLATSNANIVPAGSIVLSTRAPIGHLAIAGVPMAFNQGCRALVPRPGTESRFLFYSISASTSALQVEGRGATFTELSGQQLAEFGIDLPDQRAQNLIADFLDRETDRIDALIDAKRRLIHLLADKRTALITHAVTKGLDLTVPTKDSGIPWIGEIPAHWEEALLNKVARMGSGHTPSRSRTDWWVDCTIPWITTGEVAQIRDGKVEYVEQTREKVSVFGLANSSAVVHPAETVFLSRTASAGFSGIMAVDMATSQDFVTWTCGQSVLPRFVLLCLRAMRRDLLERLAQGSTHQTIYMPDVSSIQIPVPPVEEQQRIVDHFWSRASKLDRVSDFLYAQLTLLSEYRQAVITSAITGQLDEATLRGRKPADGALGVEVPS